MGELRSALTTSLASLAGVLDGAIVYVDETVADCVVSSFGFGELLSLVRRRDANERCSVELGALNVHDVTCVSRRDAVIGAMLSCGRFSADRTPNVVIFSMQYLHHASEKLIRLIEMHPKCEAFAIMCCYSVDAHAALGSMAFGQNAYADYEERLTAECQKHNPAGKVGIRFCPWLWSSLTSQSFLLPHSAVSNKDSPLGWGSGKGVPGEGNGDVHCLSQSLVGMASHLGRKLDVFTLGADAQTLGTEVVKLGVPVGFNDTPPEKTAALVLVDRCFDLVAPLHYADALLARILDALEAKKDTVSRYGITRLSELSTELTAGMGDTRVHTSLFAAEPAEQEALVSHLVGRTCRDGSMYIRKWIREEIRDAGLRSEYKPRAGPPNKTEFSQGAELLQKATQSAKRQAVRSLATWTAEALDSENGLQTRAEILQSNEKQILNMSSTDDLVKYFPDLLLSVTRPSALLEYGDVCGLLAFAYSVLCDETESPLNLTEEKWILEAFVQSLMDDPNPAVLERLIPGHADKSAGALKMEVRSALQKRMNHIKKLASMRSGLRDLRRLCLPNTTEHRPLIQSVVAHILEDRKLRDLHRVTSALGGLFEGAPGTGLLSKGLGRLGIGRQQESAVGGHDLVIVFVLGGISLHEIDCVAKEVEENGKGPWKPQILLGSNALLTPKQTIRQIWDL